MKRNRESLLYSAGGAIVLVAILIVGNFLLTAFNARVDLTQGNVYTLSPGTKAILSKLEAPVRIRFYYTQGSNAVPVGLKTFAQRVEDLLAEYRRASNGKVVIERCGRSPREIAARAIDASAPIRRISCLAVVRPGKTWRASGASSKPMTLTSFGIETPFA